MLFKRIMWGWLALTPLLALTPAFAQTAETAAPLDKAAELDRWVGYMVENHHFNGAVLVIEGGKSLFNRAYGKANFERGQNLSASSLFNLADVSEAFTAVAVLQLKEQGKLGLDDEVSKYLPELGVLGGITIRQLLNHTSGLSDYAITMSIHWDKHKTATNGDVIKVWQQYAPQPNFRAGARFEKSPTNYAFLASIVERVSGKDFAVYCLEQLFAPAGMTRSYVYKPAASSDERVRAYRSYLLKSPTLDEQGYLEGVVGDKNVLSCLNDLVLWEQALQTNKLLKAATLSEAFVASTTANGQPLQSGFGWSLPSGLQRRVAEMDGQLGGFGVVYTRLLDEQHAVIVMSNMQFSQLFSLADGCYNILTGLMPREPKIAVGHLVADVYAQEGIAGALKRFSAVRNNAAQRSRYDLRESELNMLGFELMELGKIKDAIEIFKANADAFQRSFNVYDSLAEAYLADGQRENAIVNYRKSLSLYPENVNAANQLRKLGEMK